MQQGQLKLTAFFNEAAIGLVQKEDAETTNHILIRSRSDMWRYLDRYFNRSNQGDIVLAGNQMESLKNDFILWFSYTEAAGGIVKNKDGAYLLINRFDVWDLPKGKIKTGEKPETAAKREVAEETGVNSLEIIKTLPPTWHIYEQDDQYFLKRTQWYLMQTDYNGQPEPQTEEEIEEVAWMNRKEAIEALNNSYRTLREVLVPLL